MRKEVTITSVPAQPAVLTAEQPVQTVSAPYGTYHTYGGHPITAEVMRHTGHTDEIVLQHTCSSCGKFRSPSYHSRHPLAPGELPKPGVCRKCIKEHTSSEDSDKGESRHRRSRGYKKSRRKKNRKRRRADYSDSTKESSSSKEEVRIIRRSYSAGGGRRSRKSSESRSSSDRQARISITYEPAERKTRQSSRDAVRIVESTDHVESRRRRRSRSRSSSRDSSGDFVETVGYLDRSGRDSGARIVQPRNHLEGRRRSRSRSRSRNSSGDLVEAVRYLLRSGRRRSRSSSRSPPRHVVQRIRYVDVPMRARSRSRSRSSSRHETLQYERSGEYRIEEDHAIRYYNVVERQSPPPIRHIDYGYEESPMEGVIRRKSSILRRSECLDTHHRTPHPAQRRVYLNHSSGTYPRHLHEDPHYVERSYEYEPHVDSLLRPPSHSVRVVRVSTDDPASDEHPAPRVLFARPASPRRSFVMERPVVESSEPVHRRRRRRVRAGDEDLFPENSEEYSLPGIETFLSTALP